MIEKDKKDKDIFGESEDEANINDSDKGCSCCGDECHIKWPDE